MAGFKFPSTIRYDDRTWHFIYAPDDSNTVMPNLDGSQLTSVTCNPVKVEGRPTPIYIAIFDVVFPAGRDAQGRVTAERRMKGFRTFAEPPLNPASIKPWECAFYLAESRNEGDSASQRFFDALIGQAQQMQPSRDSSWCESLAELQRGEQVNNERETTGTADQQCQASD